MKDRRGGAGFPFSIGCMSQSAVAVAEPLDKKPPAPAPQPQQADNPSSSTTTTATAQERGAGEETSEDKARNAAPSGVVTAGVQRLLRGIKTFFAAYDGEEEEDDEEREIVIGYPTDVQHVGHIGWDGINKVGGLAGAFSLPSSLSLRQLDIAMDPGAATTTCIN
ncbi:hypothetical protein ACQJBY_047131 [Aegilops geniculata]